MKIISIYQENADVIVLNDDDTTNKELYIKKLSSLLSPDSNISILITSSKSIILRPSKITSIEVEEIKDDTNIEEKIIKEEVKIEVEEIIVENEEPKKEDIITDKEGSNGN